jgi:hypothetical protein
MDPRNNGDNMTIFDYFTQAQRLEFIKLWRDQVSTGKMAIHFGISENQTRLMAKALDLESRPSPWTVAYQQFWTPQRDATLLALHKSGANIVQMQKALDVRQQWISRRRGQLGLTTPAKVAVRSYAKPSEAEKIRSEANTERMAQNQQRKDDDDFIEVLKRFGGHKGTAFISAQGGGVMVMKRPGVAVDPKGREWAVKL